MTINPAPDLEAFYAALWIGVLLVATDTIADPYLAELDQLAA